MTIHEKLYRLLKRPLRHSFLHREHHDQFPNYPSEIVENVVFDFLHDIPEVREKIQKIAREHAMEETDLRSSWNTIYTPEMLKQILLDVGWEVWIRRYDGEIKVIFHVTESKVTVDSMLVPDG